MVPLANTEHEQKRAGRRSVRDGAMTLASGPQCTPAADSSETKFVEPESEQTDVHSLRSEFSFSTQSIRLEQKQNAGVQVIIISTKLQRKFTMLLNY